MRKYQFILTTITLVSGSVIKGSYKNKELLVTTEVAHSVKDIRTNLPTLDNTFSNSSDVNPSTILSKLNEHVQTTVQNSLIITTPMATEKELLSTTSPIRIGKDPLTTTMSTTIGNGLNENVQTTVQHPVTTTTSVTTEKDPMNTTMPMTTRNTVYVIKNIHATRSLIMKCFDNIYGIDLVTALSKLIEKIRTIMRNILTTIISVITGKTPLTTTTPIINEKNPLISAATMFIGNVTHVLENTHAAQPFVINCVNNSNDINLDTILSQIIKNIIVQNSLTTDTPMITKKNPLTSTTTMTIGNAMHVVENTHAAQPFVINGFNSPNDINLDINLSQIIKNIMVQNSPTTDTPMTTVKYTTTIGPLTSTSKDNDDDDDDDNYYDLYNIFT